MMNRNAGLTALVLVFAAVAFGGCDRRTETTTTTTTTPAPAPAPAPPASAASR